MAWAIELQTLLTSGGQTDAISKMQLEGLVRLLASCQTAGMVHPTAVLLKPYDDCTLPVQLELPGTG